jgi:RNA polymerase sigma factor (sigma-70 family)
VSKPNTDPEERAKRRRARDEADRQLLPGLLRADQQAWDEFYKQYNPWLDSFFYRKGVQDDRDREDLFSETMQMIVVSLVSFDPTKGALRNWVYGVAQNVLLRHWARKSEAPVQIAEDDEAQSDHDDKSMSQHEQPLDARHQQLKEAIDKLSERDQRILLLRSERSETEWTWKALAEEMGIGESAAKMAYRRALERLKNLMGAMMAPQEKRV